MLVSSKTMLYRSAAVLPKSVPLKSEDLDSSANELHLAQERITLLSFQKAEALCKGWVFTSGLL